METENRLYARTYYYGVRVMIFKPSSLHKFFFTYICPRFYGGGAPSTPTQTTQTVNQNTIPKELLPYAKNMLNRAEPLSQAPYVPYSTNAEDYVAPFSPLQKKAQEGAANLQTPGQFAPASQMAGLSGLGSMTAGAQYAQQATNPTAVGAYMNPYLQQSLAPQLQLLNQEFGIKQAQQQGAATQAGAFGGSREALQGGLINQGQALAQQKMISEGYNQAFNQAQNAQQFGANLGLQGYGQGIQAAGQLGQLGTQQLAAEQGVLGTQSQFGGQQQAQQQKAIDQAVQDYQNAQMWPYMQLGFMSDLIRGVPMGNVTQTQYQAQPGLASQLGGLAATAGGAYMASRKEGGPIKDKGFKAGGIVGYKIGGGIEESMRSKLEDLDRPHLIGIIQKNESPEMTGIAKEVLATKLAKGGIVGYAKGSDGKSIKDKTQIGKIVNTEYINKNTAALPEDITPSAPKSLFFAPNEEVLPSPAASTLGIPMSAQTPTITEEGAASPTGIAGVPEAPGVVKPAATMPPSEYMTQLQKDMEEAETKANRPVEDIIEEIKKREEDYAGKDTATADYREKLTQERANSKDEARRLMGMRVMEIGANWASTPGAPLVAGMKALKEGLPGIMEDTKANKKAMKDLDAAIYGLEHATRLEDLGRIKEAEAEKDKYQSIFLKHKETWIDVGMKKKQLDQEAAIAEKKMASEEKIANARIASYGGKGALTANARINTLTSLADDYIADAEKAETPEDEADYLAKAAVLRKQAAELAGADPGLGTTIGGDIASQAKAELERRRGAK